MKARDFRDEARVSLSGHWPLAAVVTLVASLLGGVSLSGARFEYKQEITITQLPQEWIIWFLLIFAVSILVGLFFCSVVAQGYYRFILNLNDRNTAEFRDLFSQFRAGHYIKAVSLAFFHSLYIWGWSLLFIIPGIIAGYNYAMAPYILLDNPSMTARECLAASKAMMRGHRWQLFCLELSFLGWALLCILTLGIGNYFLTPYTHCSKAAFYRYLCRAEGSSEFL